MTECGIFRMLLDIEKHGYGKLTIEVRPASNTTRDPIWHVEQTLAHRFESAKLQPFMPQPTSRQTEKIKQ